MSIAYRGVGLGLFLSLAACGSSGDTNLFGNNAGGATATASVSATQTAGATMNAASAGSGGAGGVSTTSSQTSSGSAMGGSSSSTTSNTSSSNASSSNTASSNTAASSSSGGCVVMNPVEDCTNGVDDDCNGLTDCDDPACTVGFSCVDVPAGWQGPFALQDGAGALPPNACAGFGSTMMSGGTGAMGAPAACSVCTCNAAVCTPAPLDIFPTPNCISAGVPTSINQPAQGVCDTVPVVGESFKAEPPSGVCKPSQETSTVAPPTWTNSDAVCAPTAVGTCPKNGPAGVCVAKAPAPLDGECVAHAGNQVCPAGYPKQHQFVTDVLDTRSCSDCQCSGIKCGGNTHMWVMQACAGNAIDLSIPNDGACHTAPAANGAMEASIKMDMGGQCPPSGGVAMGGVMDGPSLVTVCCQ